MFGAGLDHGDTQGPVTLQQAGRHRNTGRATAHHDHIVLPGLTRALGGRFKKLGRAIARAAVRQHRFGQLVEQFTQLLHLPGCCAAGRYWQIGKAQPQGLRGLLHRGVFGLLRPAFMVGAVAHHAGKTQRSQGLEIRLLDLTGHGK